MLSGLDRLCEKLGRRWKPLDQAREQTASLQKTLRDSLERLIPGDTSFVAFGSIARQEYTLGSDVDWTLLVDGQADPEHFNVAHAIREQLHANNLQEPGTTETFGQITFSHELVHHIGGQADTNQNTTRRILMLLESVAIGETTAYQRVIRAVLSRYLDNDISFLTRSSSGEHYKVPRFLLNDIVRYWRTICVDYATKFRERQGAGWALRNAKLRMSRKLIFASGLMTCFSCFLKPSANLETLFETNGVLEPLVSHLETYIGRTPIDIMADALNDYAPSDVAANFFDAYARFLQIIGDAAKRERLKKLEPENARNDLVFKDIREISRDFQAALDALFFESPEPKLTELTRKYGMF
jgi:predicted nucleotidyltransferase